ncbi:uncharacterized protein LOC118435588 [Folsomia candida]|uniref:uncharacterized protein LOC118435588 n=1 Tax=Folsomia candida TaxID=158441 RepID=UPI001604D97C|nr:uncharacterized protein LOC118435588 [Folsomia candida]
MTVLSSWYDACVTSQITKPLEKYVIQTISEVFYYFGFKLYPRNDDISGGMVRLSIRRIDGERHLFKKSLHVNLTIFYQLPGAAIFADEIAFEPNSGHVQNALHFLKLGYPNVTCNIVKEIFYKENVVWEFLYFGGDRLSATLKTLSSNGIFLLYEKLWIYVDLDQRYARMHPVIEDLAIGAFRNLWVAFQLLLVLIGGACLCFVFELSIVYVKRIRVLGHIHIPDHISGCFVYFIIFGQILRFGNQIDRK